MTDSNRKHRKLDNSNILHQKRKSKILKQIDFFKHHVQLLASRKSNNLSNPNGRTTVVGIGSNIGGSCTMFSLMLISLILYTQCTDMLSGTHDNVNTIRYTNKFDDENNQVLINDYNFMPSMAIHIEKNNKEIEE